MLGSFKLKLVGTFLALSVLPLAAAFWGFSQVAESIREALERRSLDQKIEEWVASLRRREAVRRPPPRSR